MTSPGPENKNKFTAQDEPPVLFFREAIIITPREQRIREERAALIDRIRFNPEKSLREAYADLLERSPLQMSDPARAKFIRLQIARCDSVSSDEKREILHEEQAILRKHKASWESVLAPAYACEWDRGFISGVTLKPNDFVALADKGLLALEPISRITNSAVGGSVEESGADLERMLKHPLFRKTVSRLEFLHGGLEAAAMIQRQLPRDSVLREVTFSNYNPEP